MEGKKTTKRECSTLQNLCLSVVCDSIRRGVPLHFPKKLNTPISDLIFNNLHIPHLDFRDKNNQKVTIIEKYFSISHITLGESNYDPFFHDMIAASKTIKKLELLSLKKSIITSPNPNGKKKGCGKSLDINRFITRLLKNSRSFLKSLTIQGVGCRFPQGWIGDIHKTLPSLTFLDITGCSLSNDEFKVLCSTYSKLTSLSIGRTNVNDLTGIEELEELTFLSLEDLQYRNESCFYSVFLLEKLVVLNISSNTGQAETAELLTKRRTPLPQLQFLDCSGNKLTAATVKVLFKQNPKLQNIAVINTTYNRTLPAELVQFKEGAKFFNVSDLASCSDSLMIYHSHKERSKKILSRIQELIGNEIANRNLQDIKKCSKALLLVLLSDKQSYGHQTIALICFLKFFNNAHIRSIFTTKEKEEIARATVKTIAVVNWIHDNCPGFHLYIIATKLLVNTGILGDDPSLIQQTAVTMMKTLAKGFRSNGQPLFSSRSFLYEHRELLQKPGLFSESLIWNLKVMILDLLERNGERSIRNHQVSLELLSIVLSLSNKFSYHNSKLLEKVFSKIGPYQTNQHVVEMSFACALKLYLSLDGREMRDRIFLKHCFENIENIVQSQQASISRPAVEFLLQIYKYDLEPVKYEPYSLDELKQLTNEIENLIVQPFSQLLGITSIFKFIKKTTSCPVVRGWANWINRRKTQKIVYPVSSSFSSW